MLLVSCEESDLLQRAGVYVARVGLSTIWRGRAVEDAI